MPYKYRNKATRSTKKTYTKRKNNRTKNTYNKQLLQQRKSDQQKLLTHDRNRALELKFQFKYLTKEEQMRYYLSRSTMVAELATREEWIELKNKISEEMDYRT